MTDLLSRTEAGAPITASQHDANIALIEATLALAEAAIPGSAQSETAVATLPHDATWDPNRRFASYRVTAWSGSPAEFRVRQKAAAPSGHLIWIQNHNSDGTFTLRLEMATDVYEDYAMPPATMALLVGCADGRWRPLYLGPRRPVRGVAGAPGSGDSQARGYGAGTVWVDTATGSVYVLRDPTAGAPVWQQIYPAAGTAGIEIRNEGNLLMTATVIDAFGAGIEATNQGSGVARFTVSGTGGVAVPSPVGAPAGKVVKTTGPTGSPPDSYVLGDDLTANPTSTAVPTMVGNFGAVAGDVSGNGGTNATAFQTNLSTQSAVLTPSGGGIYRCNNLTISGHLIVMKGAVLRPNSGQTITFAAGATVMAEDYMWLDGSAGGSFAGLDRIRRPCLISWANGGDLGAMFNNLRAWGARRIHFPTTANALTISTPCVCVRDMAITGDYQGNLNDNAQLVFVSTGAGKAVFEALPNSDSAPMYNVVFENLSFFAPNNASAPSCMFWCGARIAANGYYLRWFRVTAHGHFRLAVLYDVSCEECMVRDCNWRVFSHPGTTNSPRRGVCVHSQSHVATELTTSGGQPTPEQRSHSAWSYDGGDYWEWNSTTPSSGVFVLLNHTWDFTIEPDYCVNGNGGSNGGVVVIDGAGLAGPTIYGIRIGVKGRIEGNAPLLHIDWPSSFGYTTRAIAILYGTNFSHVAVVRGETGTERISGLYIDDKLFSHWDDTDELFRGIDQIVNSNVVHRAKPMRWVTSAGGDRFASVPGVTEAAIAGSTFDLNYKNAAGAQSNFRVQANGGGTL